VVRPPNVFDRASRQATGLFSPDLRRQPFSSRLREVERTQSQRRVACPDPPVL